MEANKRAAIHVAPDERRRLWVVGELLTLKMVGSDTDGAFALIEEVTPPEGGPPPLMQKSELASIATARRPKAATPVELEVIHSPL